MMDDQLTRAAAVLAAARHIFGFTGAGVSAESGVPTFRDAQTGLWSKFSPEQLASQAGFAADPGFVWRWYAERLASIQTVRPNPGHLALARLQALTPAFTLATQNIDDLHERAGSRDVAHLHGTIARFHCNGCGAAYAPTAGERSAGLPPICPLCGDYVRPSVVWFGELLPEEEFERAARAARACDVALIVGAGGLVYPAAHLPVLAKERGAAVIDINPDQGPMAMLADIALQGPGGVLLPELVRRVEEIRAAPQP